MTKLAQLFFNNQGKTYALEVTTPKMESSSIGVVLVMPLVVGIKK